MSRLKCFGAKKSKLKRADIVAASGEIVIHCGGQVENTAVL